MAWIFLVVAGLFEASWTFCLKNSNGFTRLWPSVGTIVCILSSFGMFTLALRSLPIGTAYAVWTGVGASGTAIMGMIYLGEARDVARLVCIFLIVSGLVGLRITASHTG